MSRRWHGHHLGGGLWYRPGAASAATPASTPAAAVATLAIVGPWPRVRTTPATHSVAFAPRPWPRRDPTTTFTVRHARLNVARTSVHSWNFMLSARRSTQSRDIFFSIFDDVQKNHDQDLETMKFHAVRCLQGRTSHVARMSDTHKSCFTPGQLAFENS